MAIITTGFLKEETPYQHIFLDGKVPLISLFPCRPREDNPYSFMVDSGFLTCLQKELLARLLNSSNPDKTHGECLRVVNQGIAIDTKWFHSTLRHEQNQSATIDKIWDIASDIDSWLSTTTMTGLIALLNISYREQTKLSYQVNEWGFDDIPGFVVELIDNLPGEQYLELAYYLSGSAIESLLIRKETA